MRNVDSKENIRAVCMYIWTHIHTDMCMWQVIKHVHACAYSRLFECVKQQRTITQSLSDSYATACGNICTQMHKHSHIHAHWYARGNQAKVHYVEMRCGQGLAPGCSTLDSPWAVAAAVRASFPTLTSMPPRRASCATRAACTHIRMRKPYSGCRWGAVRVSRNIRLENEGIRIKTLIAIPLWLLHQLDFKYVCGYFII